MIFNLTDLSPLPLYQQISSQLADKIVNGELREGIGLLPIRTLARREHINVRTVQRAYEKLDKDGLICLQKDDSYLVAPLSAEWKKRSRITARYEINDDLVTRQRLGQELEMARKIQAELLPKSLPDWLGFSIEGYTEPSYEIGGDFYNIIPLGEERWGVVIGDACGKGLPAALLAAQTQAVVASEMRHKQDIKEIMKNVNEHIFSSTPSDKFVTMVTGIFNKKNQTFTYCIAGHEHPIAIRAYGRIEQLNSSSPGLGLMKDTEFKINSMKLQNRDMIFMFTDGVTEIRDDHKNEYGVERLVQVLKQNRGREPRTLINKVLFDLRKFGGEYATEDDRTILIMKIVKEN